MEYNKIEKLSEFNDRELERAREGWGQYLAAMEGTERVAARMKLRANELNITDGPVVALQHDIVNVKSEIMTVLARIYEEKARRLIVTRNIKGEEE